jgi:uncharacterized membrane protein YeaQ/YmgE (transglycosylase-associated protein family)
MSLLGWIVIGFVAGGLARIATGSDKRGCLGTTLVGVVGAVLGGFLFSLIDEPGMDDFSWWSLLVAFIGATAFLLVLQLIGRRKKE